jgi:hypothetical protein
LRDLLIGFGLSCFIDSYIWITVWIPLQSLGILYYILRRYLPTVYIYGGDAIFDLWLSFIHLIYHVREICWWFYPIDLWCSRDLLLVWFIIFERFIVGLNYDVREILVPELVFEYPTISQHPLLHSVLHPPSIFTYGLYLRWGCDLWFVDHFYPFDLSCSRDLLIGLIHHVWEIYWLDWFIMFERFIVGLNYAVREIYWW